MLSTSEQTLEGLTAQAASLEKHVEHAQKEKARKMAQQKAAYEGKLRAEELANRALVAQNTDISRQNEVLRNGNGAIRTHAQQLQASNLVARQELLALQSRLSSVQDFVGQSLTRTDDGQAMELRVLKAPAAPAATAAPAGPAAAAPEPQETQAPVQPLKLHSSIVEAHAAKAEEVRATRTVAVSNTKAAAKDGDKDDDDDAADEDEGDAAASLLAVGKAKRRQEPLQQAATNAEAGDNARELIKVLQKGVASLGEQERASETQLKALFDSSFQAGARRQRKLLAKQESLNSTRASLTALQGELRAAEAHLEATQKQLGKKLHDTGAFLQKLAHLALAPTAEVSGLTKGLPVSVSPTVAPSVAAEPAPSFAETAETAEADTAVADV